MESVVEEAFEVQVLQPFHGWTLERFCDRSGNTYHALTRAVLRVTGRDDRLNGVAEAPELEVGVLRSPEWMWSHAWMPDSEYTQCDEEGWTYGSSIERINCRLAEGTSKVKRGYYHFLRRRRWIRTRVRTPLSTAHAAEEETRAGSPSYNDDHNVRESRLSESPGPNRYYRVYRDALKAYFQLGSAKKPSNFVRVDFTDDDIQKEWMARGARHAVAQLEAAILFAPMGLQQPRVLERPSVHGAGVRGAH